jgi:PKD repeat protein/type IV secretory pathway VirB2 component (pilin)
MKTLSHKKQKTAAIIILGILLCSILLNTFAFTPGAAAADTSKTSFTDFKGGLQAPTAADYSPSLTQAPDAKTFILNVVNFFLGFLGIIAVIVVIYGGIMYVTDMGKGESQGKGKKAIQYAITGLLIVLASYAIVNTILQSPGGGTAQHASGGTGVSANMSFNRLALQVKAISKDIENAYVWQYAVDADYAAAYKLLEDTNKYLTTNSQAAQIDPNVLLNTYQNNMENVISTFNRISNTFPSMQSSLQLGDNSMQPRIDALIATLKNEENAALNIGRATVAAEEDRVKREQDDCNSGLLGGLGVKACAKSEPLYPAAADDMLKGIAKGRSPKKAGSPDDINGFDETKNSIKERFNNVVIGAQRKLKEIYLIVAPITDIANENFTNLISNAMMIQTVAVAGNDNLYWDNLDKETASKMRTLRDCVTNEIKGISACSPPPNPVLPIDDAHLLPTLDDEIGLSFSAAITELSALYEKLKDLKFVDANLTASTLSGNAPLVVDFSSIGSTNPNGKTILDNQIQWDLNGNDTTDDTKDGSSSDGPTKNVQNCAEKPAQTSTCTYLRPGTWRVTLRIKSAINDTDINPVTGKPYNKEIGAGVSTITIKVNPPQTRINLSIMPVQEGEATQQIIQYDPQGFLQTNMDSVSYLSSVAAQGLVFNATLTRATNGDEFSKQASDGATVKWDFGDGTTGSQTKSTVVTAEAATTQNLKKTHSYTKDGTYTVKVEFTDKNKIVDRKMFNVVVGPAVAQIDIPDTTFVVNKEIMFDGSNSRADGGQITSYEWKCEPSCPDFTKKGANTNIDDKVSYKFGSASPDGYKISLSVKDDQERLADASTTIYIPVKPPVAKFTYTFPEKATPQMVRFDASSSYFPDITGVKKDQLKYIWQVDGTPAPVTNGPGVGYSIRYPNGASDLSLAEITFNSKKIYKVALQFSTTDKDASAGTYEKQIEISNLLDIALTSPVSKFSASLGNSIVSLIGKNPPPTPGTVSVELKSSAANSYEVDFGDGTAKESGAMVASTPQSVSHTYTIAGTYMMNARVFDADNNENTLTHKIFINSATEPTPIISVLKNGEEYYPVNGETIEANRKDVFSFDAGQSINTDGTSRRLNYIWKFGLAKDGIPGLQPISSKKNFNKTFTDIGDYIIALDTTNADKVSEQSKKPDTLKISVKGEYPTLSGLTAVPTGSSLATPVQVLVKAIDANDPDGEIVNYKWWYYNEADGEQRGIQVSQSPQATLTIGTRGKENVDVIYKFGVALTDNDNNIIKVMECKSPDQVDAGPNEIIMCVDQLPVLTVTNGPNKEPIAKFDVDRTSINVGESVSFISSSSDPDGQIKAYYWDWEGDGFANNTKDEGSNPTHTFKKAAKSGIKVRLKVVDNNDSEAISDPVTIYVEGNTLPPVAAFVSAQQGTTMKVDFKDNSTVDTANGATIKSGIWDFDTSVDSNGDGKKDNDIDSTTQNPTYTYPSYGIKRAKLIITDDEGNMATVTNFVNVKAPAAEAVKTTQPPVAAFVSVQQGTTMKVDFKNNSTADTGSGAVIKSLVWDVDTSVDSNGDGKPDNDADSTIANPTFEYPSYGIRKAKLTVTDDKGKTGTVSNLVNAKAPAAVTPTPAAPTPTPTPLKPAAPEPSAPALDARLITVPSASVKDGKIHLQGESGKVILDFSTSTGNITKYAIDKNILFDSNGNGIPSDDEDYSVTSAGKWETDFQKAWGNTVIRLTVFDTTGKKDSVDKTIVFDAAPLPANPGLISVFGVDVNDIGAVLVSIIGFAILGSIVSSISKANK